MQSGISVSPELHQAFTNFLDDKNQRGLLISIKNEKLVPEITLQACSLDFIQDLGNLGKHITASSARYILLRRNRDQVANLILITYVPDEAPVRDKMLYAATRMSLQRELGVEQFQETFFATRPEELTPGGWMAKDVADEVGKNPLTEEESRLLGAKVQAAAERSGTSLRSGHVSTGLRFPVGEGALKSLKDLATTGVQSLIQLRINLEQETIELASKTEVAVAQVSDGLAAHEPRFSFYKSLDASIWFIYTCPSSSKIKEKMLYAASRAGIISFAETTANLKISGKVEASEPHELTADFVEAETQPDVAPKLMFSKPKRPVRR